jgi:hypothetical protein
VNVIEKRKDKKKKKDAPKKKLIRTILRIKANFPGRRMKPSCPGCMPSW